LAGQAFLASPSGKAIIQASGISGIFNVKPYWGSGAFKELMNESYFRMVRPAHYGIAWPHEQGFSADTIIWAIANAQQGAPADAKTRRG
jgi:hypothetical protein